MPLPELLPAGYGLLRVLSHQENRLVACVRSPEGLERVLKCLLPPSTPEQASELRNEFLLLDALAHPCWVRPVRFGVLPADCCFLEMESLPGRSLTLELAGWSRASLEAARRVLSALEVLHRQRIAHLDLRPDQILVHRGGGEEDPAAEGLQVRLIDLGLAAPFSSPVKGRGSPGYMAPEILRGQEAWDARSDLYSLGAILFEVFCGFPAFPGATAEERLRAQIRGAVPAPPGELGLPPRLVRLLESMLAPDPAERPGSALEVWQRLREDAPADLPAGLPPRLTGSPEFSFFGRDAVIESFRGWIRDLAAAPSEPAGRDSVSLETPAVCRIVGEPGIGRKRLAKRLLAVAQADGWTRADLGPASAAGLRGEASFLAAGALRFSGKGAPVDLRLVVEDDEPPGDSAESGEAARSRVLRLGPMPDDDLRAILRTHGIESDALIEALVPACLGSPGLLLGLVREIPREYDLASRYAGNEQTRSLVESVPVPSAFQFWADRIVRRVGPKGGDLLILAALMPDHGSAAALLRLAGAEESSLAGLPERRGLVRRSRGRIVFRSVLWERALAQLDRPRTIRLGRLLLDRRADLEREDAGVSEEVAPAATEADAAIAEAAGSGRVLARRTRLALLVERWDVVREALPTALHALHAAGLHQEGHRLLAEVARTMPVAENLFGEGRSAILRDLCEALPVLGKPEGRELPRELADHVRAAGDPEEGRILLAWASAARGQAEEAEALLPATPGSAETLLASFWIRNWVHLGRGERETAQAEASRLRGLLPPDFPHREYWLHRMAAGPERACGRYDRSRTLLEEVRNQLPRLPDAERACFLEEYAVTCLNLSDYAECRRAATEAERIFRTLGLDRGRRSVMEYLCPAEYVRGNLQLVREWTADLLRERVQAQSWERALSCLVNLAVLELERGRLRAAARGVEDARETVWRHDTERGRARLSNLEALVAVRTGRAEKALALCDRFLAAPTAGVTEWVPMLRASRGEAHYLLGDPAAARDDLERAVREFEELGDVEDFVDALVIGGLSECVEGEQDRAREFRSRLDTAGPQITPLALGLIHLLDGEIALLGAADGAPPPAGLSRAAALLDRAVETLEAHGRAVFSWRARWRLGQAQAALGRAGDAARNYATARTGVMDMIEPLGGEEQTAFLSMPVLREFGRDLAG